MANHFPSIPSLSLVSVTYTAHWNYTVSGTNDLTNLAYFDVTGVVPMSDLGEPGSVLANTATPLLVVPFVLTTPGDPGSFDQDTEEGNVATVLDNIAQAVATATGNTLATVQGWIEVDRQWLWQDESGQFNLVYNDTMTYPA